MWNACIPNSCPTLTLLNCVFGYLVAVLNLLTSSRISVDEYVDVGVGAARQRDADVTVVAGLCCTNHCCAVVLDAVADGDCTRTQHRANGEATRFHGDDTRRDIHREGTTDTADVRDVHVTNDLLAASRLGNVV